MSYPSAFRRFVLMLVLALPTLAILGQPGLSQETTPSTAAPVKATTPADEAEAKSADNKKVFAPGAMEAIARAKRQQAALTAELKTLRKEIASPDATIESLVKSQGKLTDLRKQIAEARPSLITPVNEFAAKLKELGPAPKKGETEAASITGQRTALEGVSNDLQAALKQLDLLDVEANQLAARTSELQKQAFVKRVLVAHKSVLNPQLWWDFTTTLSDAGARVTSVFQVWFRSDAKDGKISGPASFFLVFAIDALAVMLVWFVWTKMSNPPRRLGDASNLRRIWRAVGGIGLVTLIGMLAIATGAVAIKISSVEDLRIPRVVVAGGEILFISAVMVTVLRAVLAPTNAAWRLVNIDDPSARILFRYGAIAALIFGIDYGAATLADITFMPLDFVIGFHAIVSILLIIVLAKIITICRSRSNFMLNIELHGERNFYFDWAHRFFLVFWLLVAVSFFALLLGYVALAHFILTNTLVTSALIIVLYLVHHLVDALVTSSTQPWSRIGKRLRENMGFADDTIQRVGLLLSTITDVSVIVIGIPLVLALWTITWIDFSGLATQAFFGFKIGDIYVEPSKILLGIVMFGVGIVLVRVLTLWLNRRILGRSTIDAGVQNSIATGAKYTGITLAAGFALTAAGLDFSKLAIVAGALSVGIGFGLQSVVSNFVSGLILLAERPIRIGDWIEVGAGEGVVKQINVRSTEIETFDRCSVIVPNSSFISDPVKNWSQGSSVGRIKVNVGVAYDADPEQVRQILIDCAKAHERVISSPDPRVMFMDFGASSLDFQLRVFLDDIGYCTAVASDLRFAIFRELKAAGIEIPFPQRDINIRDVEKLSEAFVKKPPARKPRKAARK